MRIYSFSISFFLIAVAILCSCSSASIKEKVNSAGDAAGQVAGEFMEGTVQGVTKAFDVKIDLPKNLEEKGIKFGKTTVSNDSAGTDNMLTVYIIFDKNYEGTLTAKVFDTAGLEMGRSSQTISGTTGQAQFIDFHFDKRTNIDSNCKISIE